MTAIDVRCKIKYLINENILDKVLGDVGKRSRIAVSDIVHTSVREKVIYNVELNIDTDVSEMVTSHIFTSFKNIYR